MKKALLALLLYSLYSCSGIKVIHDYEKATDFTNYTTYNYYPEMNSGLTEFDEKRLLNAIDNTMQQKGILFSEEADFLINVQSRVYQNSQNTGVGIGVGGTGRNIGGGVSIGLPVGGSALKREIIFDLIDSQKDQLFWQASSVSSFRENAAPSVKEEKLKALVEKAFSKYPPKGTK